MPHKKISLRQDGRPLEYPPPEISRWTSCKNPAKNHESNNTAASVSYHPVKCGGVYHNTTNCFSTRTNFSAPSPKSLLYKPATTPLLGCYNKVTGYMTITVIFYLTLLYNSAPHRPFIGKFFRFSVDTPQAGFRINRTVSFSVG